jgi:predicted ATPase
MFEREAIRSTISGLLTAAAGGSGGAVFVVADAGMGKTSLLDDACQVAAATGVDVGRATGDVMESSLAFAVAREVLSGLGGVEAIDGPAGAQGARFFRVLEALAAHAQTRPVLLAVDDLHWADEDSLALLSFLCRRMRRSRIALVATLRRWPPQAQDAALDLVAGGHASVERLAPLSPVASGELVARAAGRPLTADELDRALTLCAGNPLLLQHLGLAMRHGEIDLEQPAAAAGLDGVVLPRFAGLPPTGFRCAQAASVLGTRFLPAVAVEVARLADADEQEALAALAGSGLVRTSPDSEAFAEFTHPARA